MYTVGLLCSSCSIILFLFYLHSKTNHNCFFGITIKLLKAKFKQNFFHTLCTCLRNNLMHLTLLLLFQVAIVFEPFSIVLP